MIKSKITKRSPSKRAFSLIEMLITLALILVMMLMLMGRGSQSRQKRDMLQCRKNLQSIFTALTIYSSDNKGVFPSVTNAQSSEQPLSLLIPRSTTETEIFICPGAKDSAIPQGESFAKRKISYAYYMGWQTNIGLFSPLVSDRQINAEPKNKDDFIFSESGKGAGANHHKYGGNILFGNGEAQKSSPKLRFDLTFPTNIVLLNPKS